MKKILPSVLYCTVLYCTVDVLGCDCCKKLCVKKKSGEEDVQKEKSVIEKKTEWEYFKKYNTQEKRTNAWKTTLLSQNKYKDDNVVVPVVWEQHDKTKGCVFHKKTEAKVIAIPKNHNVQKIYRSILNEAKNKVVLKHLVLYFNGDPKLKYDGTQTTLGEKLISDEDFLFDKNSGEPFLKRVVCLSYYAEK